jgi:hypothetical protein
MADKNQVVEIRKSLLKTGETELDILPPCDGNRGGGTDGIVKEGVDEDGDIVFRVGMMKPGENEGLHYCVGLTPTEIPFSPDQFYVKIWANIAPDWELEVHFSHTDPYDSTLPDEYAVEIAFDVLSDLFDPLSYNTLTYWQPQTPELRFAYIRSELPECDGDTNMVTWVDSPFDGSEKILKATSVMNSWILDNRPEKFLNWIATFWSCFPFTYTQDNQPAMQLIGEDTGTGERKTMASLPAGDNSNYITDIDWTLVTA